MQLKLKMSTMILAVIKKYLNTMMSKYYDDSNKLVNGKMEDENGAVAIEEENLLDWKQRCNSRQQQ